MFLLLWVSFGYQVKCNIVDAVLITFFFLYQGARVELSAKNLKVMDQIPPSFPRYGIKTPQFTFSPFPTSLLHLPVHGIVQGGILSF